MSNLQVELSAGGCSKIARQTSIGRGKDLAFSLTFIYVKIMIN